MTLLDQERKINTLAGLLLYPPGTEWDSSQGVKIVYNYVDTKMKLKLMLSRVRLRVQEQALVVLPGPET